MQHVRGSRQAVPAVGLAHFDAVGEAEASREPIEPLRCADFAYEPMRPPLSDHVTPRLRITSVEAAGSEGGPAETCAGKVVTAPPHATVMRGAVAPNARAPGASRMAVRCWWRVAASKCGLWPCPQ